jgi:hypothetical protein
VIAARAQRAAVVELDEFYGGVRICRDDRCPRVDIHAAHPIDFQGAEDPLYDAAYPHCRERHGETLCEVIYDHIPVRYCKPFQDLYSDVLEDYGQVNARAVYRALKTLLLREQIISVTLPPTKERKTKRPPGGYVRSNSPLLADADGRDFLIDTLAETRPTSWA